MLSKKHNESFYWKNKLEAADSLPVMAATEKDAMWNKLHNRLQEKPVGKKAVWYWMAAGLLPLIVIALTMVNNTNHIFVSDAVQQKKTTNAAPALLQPVSKELVRLSVSAPAEIKYRVTSIVEKTNSKIPHDTIKVSATVTTVTKMPESSSTETVMNNLQPVDTAAICNTNIVTKKKLPVVHINELENFPAEFTSPVNYAQNLSGKARKNKTNNLTLSTQQNSIGFKIKLSSKN